MKLTADIGKIAAGITHVYVPPVAGTATPARLVLCCHGAGSDALVETIKGKSNYMLRARAFAAVGLAQLWISATGADWANDAALTNLDTARQWANANLPVKTDQVLTYGNSAGNVASLAYAANHPGLVRGHAGTLPVVDIQDIHDNNRQSLAAGIETAALGAAGAIPDSWYAARSPVRRQAQLTGLAQALWYSDTDPIALPALSASYATAVGATTVDIGAQGHSISGSSPYGVAPLSDIAAWLAAHA